MRFTVNVTWVSSGASSTCEQCGAISGARFGRPAPTFTIDARDREDAISQATSILNFPLNAEIAVAPEGLVVFAKDARVAELMRDLQTFGLGWLTLTGAEVRAHREELVDLVRAASAAGCAGSHVGCNACALVRLNASTFHADFKAAGSQP